MYNLLKCVLLFEVKKYYVMVLNLQQVTKDKYRKQPWNNQRVNYAL